MSGIFSRRPDKVSTESNQGYYTKRASNLERRKKLDYAVPADEKKFEPNGQVKDNKAQSLLTDFSVHTRKVFTDTFHELVDVVADVVPIDPNATDTSGVETQLRAETAKALNGKDSMLYKGPKQTVSR